MPFASTSCTASNRGFDFPLGVIGSNFVLDWLAASDEPVINLDILSYAGNLQNLVPDLHNSALLYLSLSYPMEIYRFDQTNGQWTSLTPKD